MWQLQEVYTKRGSSKSVHCPLSRSACCPWRPPVIQGLFTGATLDQVVPGSPFLPSFSPILTPCRLGPTQMCVSVCTHLCVPSLA